MSTTCSNPRCSCSPCTCGDQCRCGTTKLGDLEQQVMEVIWESPGDELTGRDVANRLPAYAYTTVVTVLDRLTHKGLVRRRMESRVIRFSAVGTEAALAAQGIREALETTADPVEALSNFVATASPAELQALQEALEARGKSGTRA